MATARAPHDSNQDDALLALYRDIASRDVARVASTLESSPGLASRALQTGASRQAPERFFLEDIRHHVFAGDTALHIAAASYQRAVAASLIEQGASVRARNRRGAEPLHYAADGRPGSAQLDPMAQGDVLAYLIEAGADPNAFDTSGVAPLHRAVRTRSSEAVRVLLDNGAILRLMNKSGSTPLHLAVQNTGRSDSGSDAAKDEQRLIIKLLLDHGARPTDVDGKGKTVADAATSSWIRDVLDTA